ncbi:amino acid hydroxylase [Gordonia sp. NPDC003376]
MADLDIRAARERASRAHRRGLPVPAFTYTREEDALWSRVFSTLDGMHEEFGCASYLSAARRVPLPTHRVPQLADVSRTLHALTGFQLAPATGSLPGRQFYGPLADGTLHATPNVRPTAEESFSPDPDVIHELVGHAVMLGDPEFADLYRLFGRAINHADSAEACTAIARVFWFTMEVGLVAEKGRPRATGAAILSSVGEMNSLADADLRSFRVGDVIECDVDDGRCQPVLFVADSVDHMLDVVRRFLVTTSGEN